VLERWPHEVGQKKPNAWGLYDMHGNVWEWCRDRYAQRLPGANVPEVTAGDAHRVYRGGAWDAKPRYCRCAFRGEIGGYLSGVGFRVGCSR
jgi:formylglycine-generating enzyme required for sulfatase activity